MLVKDQIGFIRQHMRRNKLRVAMTVLAATMGCAFLIVLSSIGFGLHKTLMDELLSNQLITEIQIYGKQESDEPISEAEQEEMKELPGVQAVVARSHLDSSMSEVIVGDRTSYPSITLTEVEEEQKANLELSEGRMPATKDEVIVGYHFAEDLLTEEERNADSGEASGYEGSLIGQTIQLEITSNDSENPQTKMWEFTVSGVTKEPAKDWVHDNQLLINESFRGEFHAFANPGAEEAMPDFEVYVYAEDLEAVQTLTGQLKEEGYFVYSITEEMTTMNQFFTVLKAGLIFVGTIAVLIASIGIFNTMTMAVTERTREIGVMKAIGAKPKLIQRLFLMESAWIGFIGTALAVVISYGISYLANWLIPLIVFDILTEDGAPGMTVVVSAIPWQLVVIAAVISIGVAMVSGWRPARKATRIDIIQALRQEI